jgi:anti-anti-sigma regulatory factor
MFFALYTKQTPGDNPVHDLIGLRNEDMNINIYPKQGRVLVTIMKLSGKIDSSNYMELVEEAANIYLIGQRDLLIDLNNLTYLGSAGLTAIHKTALIFRDRPTIKDVSGWEAYHAIDSDRGRGLQEHVKLLSPQTAVTNVLEITGFDSIFNIQTDLNAAVASF